MNHSPEPWTAGTILIRDVAGNLINHHCVGVIGTRTANALTGVVGDEKDQLSEADAKRIELCVNACAGIDNESLADDCVKKMREDRDFLLEQKNEFKDLSSDLVEELQHSKQERTKLLEALKVTHEFIESITLINGPYPEVNGSTLVSAAYKQAAAAVAVINEIENQGEQV